MTDLPSCRCFLEGDLVPGECILPEEESRHLTRVRRLGAGDRVRVLNGVGGEADARIVSVDRHHAVLEVEDVRQVPQSLPEVTLVMGALKQSAWDELLPHLVELGVSRLIRWQSRHAVSDIAQDKRTAKQRRWRERLIQASKQSANPWLPELCWADTQAELQTALPQDGRHLLASLSGTPIPFRDWKPGKVTQPLVAWVGPEGDFTQEEMDWICTNFDAESISLGRNILRAETAALALITLLRLG